MITVVLVIFGFVVAQLLRHIYDDHQHAVTC